MKILIDMNFPPQWVEVFEMQGLQAVHWLDVGNPRATDQELMTWARTNEYIVFTHDLDFGTLLALTHAKGPSVLQIRTQDVLPGDLDNIVLAAIHQCEEELKAGALVIVDEQKTRVRILPLRAR